VEKRKTKKSKNGERCLEVSVNNQENPWSQSRRRKKGYSGKALQKREAWNERVGVTNDESGESMEPMEEVPLIRSGESKMERLVRG